MGREGGASVRGLPRRVKDTIHRYLSTKISMEIAMGRKRLDRSGRRQVGNRVQRN